MSKHGSSNEKKDNVTSTSKFSSSFRDFDDNSDDYEALLPDDEMSSPFVIILISGLIGSGISSTGGGYHMEEDDLDFYDGYEAQVYDLPEKMQSFCDHSYIRLNRRLRK
ncbi:hypothetical protein Tco_0271951 [Tanacetum coccineum]